MQLWRRRTDNELLCNVLCLLLPALQLHGDSDKENTPPLASPPSRSVSAPLPSTHTPSTDVAVPAAPPKRLYTRVSDEIRGCIIRMHIADVGAATIRVRLHKVLLPISLPTIYNILSDWKRCKKLTHAPSTPRSSPRSLAHLRDYICALQNDNHALTLKEIKALLPKGCSLSHISRTLHRANFTKKRLQKWVPNRNSDATKQLRVEYVLYAQINIQADNTIYIDESPFNISMTRMDGRSRKGTPCFIRVPLLRSPNFSVIAALSPSRGRSGAQPIDSAPHKGEKTGPPGVHESASHATRESNPRPSDGPACPFLVAPNDQFDESMGSIPSFFQHF